MTKLIWTKLGGYSKISPAKTSGNSSFWRLNSAIEINPNFNVDKVQYVTFKYFFIDRDCSGTNTKLQEIEFNCIRSKLQENAVKFNQRKSYTNHQLKHMQLRIINYRNIVTCSNLHHNFICGEMKNWRVEERLDNYQRDEPGAGHRGLALSRTWITRAGAETNE